VAGILQATDGKAQISAPKPRPPTGLAGHS